MVKKIQCKTKKKFRADKILRNLNHSVKSNNNMHLNLVANA